MGRLKKNDELHRRITEMYISGAAQKEIVETLGVSYCVVRYTLKRDGVFDPNRRNFKRPDCFNKANDAKREKAAREFAALLSRNGFALVSDYKKAHEKCKIKCFTCNKVFERQPSDFKRYGCPICKQVEIEKDRKIKREQKRELKREREKQKEERTKQKNREREAKQKKLNEVHICPECKKEFTILDYMKEKSVDNVQLVIYCSKQCSRKAYRTRHKDLHGKHKLRTLKFGTSFECGITLEKLVQRDGLTCALCGEVCDWNDKAYGSSGPNYPTIDHMIPLSKGGGHSWDNVQVAHHKCNSIKGSKVA